LTFRPASDNSEAPQRDNESVQFLKPRYDGFSICNIPETVASLLGARFSRPINDPKLSEFTGAENVILLLLDGFGAYPVDSARRNFGVASYDALFSNASNIPITSVFPSTTSSAMSSLHTGLTPQEHGVIGYTMFLSEIGTIAQMLRFVPIQGGRSLFDLGFEARNFLNAKTIHERLVSSGISSTVYVPKYIIDSGLSRITYRGAVIEPQNSVADMLVRLRKNLDQSEGPSFHFLYHASPDTLAHSRGPHSEEFAAELESIFAILRQQLFQKLETEIGKKTVLLVSGDHGAVNVPSDKIIDVTDHPELTSMLRLPPTGDSRATILHVREENQEQVKGYFQQNFPGLFEIRKSKEMLDNGYFGLGTVTPEIYNRIGDLVALPKFYNAIDNSLLDPRHDNVPGRHGGLSAEEMQVPLIVTKLS
jgi:predicted AlkP superfamily pyrophosphatase or phosphodiesterase